MVGRSELKWHVEVHGSPHNGEQHEERLQRLSRHLIGVGPGPSPGSPACSGMQTARFFMAVLLTVGDLHECFKAQQGNDGSLLLRRITSTTTKRGAAGGSVFGCKRGCAGSTGALSWSSTPRTFSVLVSTVTLALGCQHPGAHGWHQADAGLLAGGRAVGRLSLTDAMPRIGRARRQQFVGEGIVITTQRDYSFTFHCSARNRRLNPTSRSGLSNVSASRRVASRSVARPLPQHDSCRRQHPSRLPGRGEARVDVQLRHLTRAAATRSTPPQPAYTTLAWCTTAGRRPEGDLAIHDGGDELYNFPTVAKPTMGLAPWLTRRNSSGSS